MAEFYYWMGEDDRDAFDRRAEVTARPPDGERHWLPILRVAAAGFCLFGCPGAVVGYFFFGVERTSDPAEVRAALDGMTEMQLPPGLEPVGKSVQMTGVEKAEFRSGSGGRYLVVGTGPRFRLRHGPTVRDPRRWAPGGGEPELPAEERTIPATVRGEPAEFIYRRYSDVETVSGYVQGKQYPVHLDAQFDLGEFAPGTAATLVESIR